MAITTLPTLLIPPLGNFISAVKAQGDVNVALALDQLTAALQAYSKAIAVANAASSGATPVVTVGPAAVLEVALTVATTTINPAAPPSVFGQILFVVLTQDATGGRQIVWGPLFQGVTVNDINTNANVINRYLFVSRADGNYWLASVPMLGN